MMIDPGLGLEQDNQDLEVVVGLDPGRMNTGPVKDPLLCRRSALVASSPKASVVLPVASSENSLTP